MGRGRAKAKQTKVARELKYNSPNMDLDRLKADLGAGSTRENNSDDAYVDDDYGYDAYADDEDDRRSSR
ncbi:Protein of unknown function (DUF3073) [Frankia torreyi]|uniref:DUF3073 domain-containing protein n=2 Tax=Frankia TaxID=1854 RepID=Q0RUD0_FRAAA|nr:MULTISPECIES: DUF3073 domain-containing protein [Frankia]KJE22887.1 Protein of unknown function (DUF3073) [Frankia torreyi]KQC40296.1 hypothetical protein UK82_01385 [Frankia sp. ACN1ag]KQM04933.1 Protein of unknown function (DUF3073) [Frankia sp. CpI1-P]CAJ58812.1 conserved hypothetical protein [Frankia alni ACN14a]